MKWVLAGTTAVVVVSASPVLAQASPPNAATPAVATNWLSQGSDIPADPGWKFGVLRNGVRYAVRRSAQPAGTISVRVRIGVGGLMEADDQQGWSHLLEHMVFRGTGRFADGEGIKLWQRLGASFGSDTNASTTLTATTFQLDLPHADAAGFGEAMTVLADMMDTARIDQGLLTTERKVVEAERAQRMSPFVRKLRDVRLPLFYYGTKAAARDVIGTSETLANASAPRLKTYYETWYRPDNAVVVVAGDADPALLEAEVRRAFGGWQPTGKKPPAPDRGNPVNPPLAFGSLVDSQAPDLVLLDFVAPHADRPVSASRQQEQFAEGVAIGILNQRFFAAARKGDAIVNAGAQFSEQRQAEDQLLLQVQHKPGQWQQALDQSYRILNAAAANPPSKAEIDQQAAALTTAFQQQVVSAGTRTAGSLANSVVTAVEEGDVVAAPEYYTTLLAAWRATASPAAIHATMKRLLAPAPRLLVVASRPPAGGPAVVGQALREAQRLAGGAAEELRSVSLDDLKLPGGGSTVVATTPIAALDADRMLFSNGVELVFKHTAFERDRVRVRIGIGGGLLSQPRGDAGLWWTASALPGAGIGPFAPDELGRVTAGRQVGFAVSGGYDDLGLSGITNAADLTAMLKLMTGAITQPRFDEVWIARVRDATLANYQSTFSQPVAVFQAFGGAALHSGDGRFTALPARAEIERLSLPSFRRFWTERLAQGPVRVTVVGDVDRTAVTAAVAATLGTIAKRAPAAPTAANFATTAPASPIVLKHQGDPGQALVLRAFPTLGLLDNGETGAALDVAAAIIQTRLLEGFRATEGGTYTPLAAHSQSVDLPGYGVLIAGAQVQAARVEGFAHSLDTVLADLSAKGPGADELNRARATAISGAERSREDNAWWLGVLASDLSAPRIANLAGRMDRLKAVTSDTVRAAVGRYLAPAGGFTLEVLPSGSPGG